MKQNDNINNNNNKKTRVIFRKSIFAFSKSNRMPPFLEERIGDIIKSGCCPIPPSCCPVPPVAEMALLLLQHLLHALSCGRSIRAALIHKKECRQEAHVLLGRAFGADLGESIGGKRAAATKNKACFRRYRLAALSCYRENTVLFPLEKRPQLSPVRQCQGCAAQLWIRRNLFPKKTEFSRILSLSKASN